MKELRTMDTPSAVWASDDVFKVLSSSRDLSAAWFHCQLALAVGGKGGGVASPFWSCGTVRNDRATLRTWRKSLCFRLLSWMRLASSDAKSWDVIFASSIKGAGILLPHCSPVLESEAAG
jgi:hypothetical protein